MESNLIKVPFDLEMAKRITNGEINGKIVTRTGDNVRIICFDWESIEEELPIIGLARNNKYELIHFYNRIGYTNKDGLQSKFDLFLEIPEYITFTNGDILISRDNRPFIYKEVKNNRGAFGAYFGVDLIGNEFFDCDNWTCEVKGRADETQLKIIIDQLKSSKDPRAKKYLKSFLNIELKPEYKFNPFDKVLVKCSQTDNWSACFFSYKDDSDNAMPYRTTSGWVKYCIPYNDQTALLLGTNKNWED